MWHGDQTPFAGEFFQLQKPINSPMPVSEPHPTIIVCGGGEKKTLRFVAKYADVTNLVVASPCKPDSFGVLARKEPDYESWLMAKSGLLQHKLDVLRKHCEDVGRPYESVEKSVVTYIKVGEDGMAPDEILRLCNDFAALGFSYVMFVISNGHELDSLQAIGNSVIPFITSL
jgi:hypothetical protein